MKLPLQCMLIILLITVFGIKSYSQTRIDITNLDGKISAEYYDSPAGEDYENLIDRNTQTKYLTFHAEAWIQFQVPNPYIVNSYSITSANDHPERDPMSWALYGSNDGNNWTAIDSQSNQTFSQRFQTLSFSFSNTKGYSYYRLGMVNHQQSDILQLSEWNIYGIPVSRTFDPQDITNFGGTALAEFNDSDYGIQNIIDNLWGTKYFTNHAACWVEYKSDYPNLYILKKYSITSSSNGTDDNPKSWQLEASIDNLNWVILDTQSKQTFDSSYAVNEYSVTDTNQYKYFRLDITSNNGGSGLQIAELKLFGFKGRGGNYPDADFTVNTTTIIPGDTVYYKNLSQGATSLNWIFKGGKPAASTEENPVVVYDTAGVYDVSLTVSNSGNRDNLTQTGYITVEDINKQQIADEIKQEFLLCWDSYVKYAWGYDELNPLSKTGSNWYGPSFLMTPVDALDTMILMGLKSEADSARQLIDTQLNFNQDVYVSNFEFTIRFIGGLLSSYELTGDTKLLSLAKDLANRGIKAFRKSPTGMPYGDVNLKTGAVRRAGTNPAEIGTMLIEYGTLSKLTGDTTYYNTAKRALLKLYSLRSSTGLVGNGINIETGQWTGTDCSVSGGIDSYFEYLIKSKLLFNDKDCANMWKSTLTAINKYLLDSTSTGDWYGHADMNSGVRTSTQFGSLDAFFGDPLCLSGETWRAAELEESCYKMWNRYGIEPEQLDYSTMTATSPGYYLRPEIIESAYYLYHYTQNPRYLIMGKTFFDDLKKYCRTPNGYVQLSSVITHQQTDGMPSYFLAETLKYLYLLFAPPSTIDFDSVIFNTEAHPMQMNFTLVDTAAAIPEKFNLYQNYPNPFNPGTVVEFDIPQNAHVSIKIYNTLGQDVKTLVDQDMEAGNHKVEFTASGLASGVYFYQLRADSNSNQNQLYVSSNKMVYIK